VLAIIISDVLAYHADQVAPVPRMLAMEAVAEHFAGHGPVLFNEDDAFVPYFARAAKTIAPFETITPMQAQLIESNTIYNAFYDLDQMTLSYVESFPVIVTRRSPIVSRPPSNYRLAYSNTYYQGWVRERSPRVLGHLGLQSAWSGSAVPACASVRALVTSAPPHSELMQAVTPSVTGFQILTAPSRPPAWGSPDGIEPFGAVLTDGPGFVHERVTVSRGGVYAAWVQGSFPRAMRVLVGGRTVGSVDGLDSVYQWTRAGVIRLKAGVYELTVHRGGGTTNPGDGSVIGEVGYVMLAKEGGEVLHPTPLARWRSLCGKAADWIELVHR
jgi:hypothetical protein